LELLTHDPRIITHTQLKSHHSIFRNFHINVEELGLDYFWNLSGEKFLRRRFLLQNLGIIFPNRA
jgi:hypothetical protein